MALCASVRLQSSDQIWRLIDEKNSALRLEIEEAQEQYESLVRVGGGRDDHAAEFLKRLRGHLAQIEKFAAACQKQLEETIANPFGD
jgi:hypothetical protein